MSINHHFVEQRDARRLAGTAWLLLAAVCALLPAASCRAVGGRQTGASQIPVPPAIQGAEQIELPDGRSQLSFVSDEAYPSSRVRDFYAEWAAENQWEKVGRGEEPWSADSWVSFQDENDVPTDQWTVHWRSPDKTRSLLLALIHRGDRTKQQVYVVLSPYYLLIPGSESETLGDHIDEWQEKNEPPPPQQ